MPETPTAPPGLPQPHVRAGRRWPSPVWVVPLIAALIGVSLLVQSWRASGPRITISFLTAEGLEVGKTPVKYRDVAVGQVSGIALSEDHRRVLITVDLTRSVAPLTTADAQFWVVRPRISVGSVSGLETLLSGAYISMESGTSTTPSRSFVGLESPPPLAHGPAGKLITLETQQGSVGLGAPVYFHRFAVGKVINETLDPDGSHVRIDTFIDAPYDRFITPATRFWDASGVEASLSGSGLSIRTESLAALLVGGIAFDEVSDSSDALPVASGTRFELFATEQEARAPPEGQPSLVRMRFLQSLRGLTVGAPVEFVGIEVGQVVSIDLDYDARSHRFPVVVTAKVYPQRMGRAYQQLREQGAAAGTDRMARLVGELVARGLRAQPRPESLLSDQLYLALDFIPSAAPAAFDVHAEPLEIPTVPGDIQQLQTRVMSILAKLDALPLAKIGGDADTSLRSLNAVLDQVDREVLPSARDTLTSARGTLDSLEQMLMEDSPARLRLQSTLQQAELTLRSVRSLADYLDRHPEALLRGRSRQPISAAVSPDPRSPP